MSRPECRQMSWSSDADMTHNIRDTGWPLQSLGTRTVRVKALHPNSSLFRDRLLSGCECPVRGATFKSKNMDDLTHKLCELLHPLWQQSFLWNNGLHQSPLPEYSYIKQLQLHWKHRQGFSRSSGMFSVKQLEYVASNSLFFPLNASR